MTEICPFASPSRPCRPTSHRSSNASPGWTGNCPKPYSDQSQDGEVFRTRYPSPSATQDAAPFSRLQMPGFFSVQVSSARHQTPIRQTAIPNSHSRFIFRSPQKEPAAFDGIDHASNAAGHIAPFSLFPYLRRISVPSRAKVKSLIVTYPREISEPDPAAGPMKSSFAKTWFSSV